MSAVELVQQSVRSYVTANAGVCNISAAGSGWNEQHRSLSVPCALVIWLPVLLPSAQVSCLPLLLPASIEQTVARSARMCAHLQGTQQRPKPPSSRTPTYLELDEAEMNELEEVCLFGACCCCLVDRVSLVGAVW